MVEKVEMNSRVRLKSSYKGKDGYTHGVAVDVVFERKHDDPEGHQVFSVVPPGGLIEEKEHVFGFIRSSDRSIDLWKTLAELLKEAFEYGEKYCGYRDDKQSDSGVGTGLEKSELSAEDPKVRVYFDHQVSDSYSFAFCVPGYWWDKYNCKFRPDPDYPDNDVQVKRVESCLNPGGDDKDGIILYLGLEDKLNMVSKIEDIKGGVKYWWHTCIPHKDWADLERLCYDINKIISRNK